MAFSMTCEEAQAKLRKYREDHTRSSEEVIEIWEEVIYDVTNKLGDELWLIYEQVCTAACDCARPDLAQYCIEALSAQFPGSRRVQRLEGLLAEATGSYSDAREIYKTILTDDPTCALVRKRMVAVLKAENKIPEAIRELNAYLKQFMSDNEAWSELCELYIQEQDMSKAAFCMEELIMSNPRSHLYHQKYAEIKYTQNGSLEDMILARKYFAQAVKLNPANMRALFGLFMAASCVVTSPKSKAKDKKDSLKVATWAAEQISSKYKDAARTADLSGQVQTITGMLDMLQVTQSPGVTPQ